MSFSVYHISIAIHTALRYNYMIHLLYSTYEIYQTLLHWTLIYIYETDSETLFYFSLLSNDFFFKAGGFQIFGKLFSFFIFVWIKLGFSYLTTIGHSVYEASKTRIITGTKREVIKTANSVQ